MTYNPLTPRRVWIALARLTDLTMAQREILLAQTAETSWRAVYPTEEAARNAIAKHGRLLVSKAAQSLDDAARISYQGKIIPTVFIE